MSGKLFRGINRADQISKDLNSSQVNRIYKKLAKKAQMQPQLIKQISGHSIRIGAAQDMLVEGENLAKMMQRGRWGKTDTVMRYIENVSYS